MSFKILHNRFNKQTLGKNEEGAAYFSGRLLCHHSKTNVGNVDRNGKAIVLKAT